MDHGVTRKAAGVPDIDDGRL